MKRLTLVLAVLCSSLPVRAEDQASHNTLTPKEVADGWILLFDGKTTFGWTSPNDSKWTILDEMLAPQRAKPGLLINSSTFSDYYLNLEFQQAKENSLSVICGSDASGNPLMRGEIVPLKVQGRGWHGLQLSREAGKGVAIRVDPAGREKASKYFLPYEPFSKDVSPLGGHLAVTGNFFIIRTIKLKPLNAKPLFNGMNLDGWKEHPGRKSKFSVTKEGWLHVQNGPGDLQTTGEWADFILQFECKTNGRNLNSGVFFRCLPGQYQMGYEAQIHNGFGPEKDYTLEVFDPKTNKLIEKKKEKFTATDYGTGAIYRRMPTRFQAAKDNEWFTITVAAQGRHFATWVNGVQTVDWTDNRPLEENARKGAYLKKGPISIQGHDPTTDLHFRNFRIAELPAK